MSEWVEANIPIRGHVFVRFEGSDLEFPIGDFEQRIPLRIEAPNGELPAVIKFEHGHE